MFGLRLDTREGAFGERDNGTPIVPGDPEASLVYQRISANDPSRRMPPAHVHKDLTPEQVETIRGWIEEGASWEEHWAFAFFLRDGTVSLATARCAHLLQETIRRVRGSTSERGGTPWSGVRD